MPAFTDQTGHTLTLDHTPKRIISIVPSQTELLSYLDLDLQVIGITKFCIHPPEWLYTKTIVGGTKKIDFGIIHQLQPDLIIAAKEENVKEQVEELAAHYTVWVSDVNDLYSACQMIEKTGLITGTVEKANTLVEKIKKGFIVTDERKSIRTAYLVWKDPYMTVGCDTFIHSMMEAAGFENVFKQRQRYPIVMLEELIQTNCELLLLSTEPFPFKQKHVTKIKQELALTGSTYIKVIIADGEMFSWYGSRMLYAPAYFKKLRDEIDWL